ncbi:helix-turn-helix domain-containing protein [Deinococcus sp.]|uniref:helix-turn-helix domain-containing protein n=1 Tax=Deinococcus sp. TaxID=47478 RepID=UPI0025B905C1|nr:helix-turn-helix domain-containing protein [Deinococcus sp.]
MNTQPITLEWRIKDVLAAHNLSAYKLSQELSGTVSRNSVYALAAGTAKRADIETVGAILAALRRMTGNDALTVADLLADQRGPLAS